MADIFKTSDQLLKTTGNCLCGNVQYQLDGPLVYNVLCHCENCRHATGTAFMCATIVPKHTFTLLSGQESLKSYADTGTQSKQPLNRHFCTNCGSNVFALTPLNADIVSVFAGGWVKETGDWSPDREQFCAQRVAGPWLDLPESVTRTKTNPMSETMKKGESAV